MDYLSNWKVTLVEMNCKIVAAMKIAQNELTSRNYLGVRAQKRTKKIWIWCTYSTLRIHLSFHWWLKPGIKVEFFSRIHSERAALYLGFYFFWVNNTKLLDQKKAGSSNASMLRTDTLDTVLHCKRHWSVWIGWLERRDFYLYKTMLRINYI